MVNNPRSENAACKKGRLVLTQVLNHGLTQMLTQGLGTWADWGTGTHTNTAEMLPHHTPGNTPVAPPCDKARLCRRQCKPGRLLIKEGTFKAIPGYPTPPPNPHPHPAGGGGYWL
jgi:hypothetical protein